MLSVVRDASCFSSKKPRVTAAESAIVIQSESMVIGNCPPIVSHQREREREEAAGRESARGRHYHPQLCNADGEHAFCMRKRK